MMKYIFGLIGAFLFIDGLLLAFYSNFNVGIILTMLIGVFLCLICVFYKQIQEKTKSGIFKSLKILTIAGMIAAVIFTAFLWGFGANDTVTYTEDVLIVLGCGVNGEQPTLPLLKRLETAVEYLNKNQTAAVIVTGGRGPQEDITEAEAMTRYLVANGISEERILREEHSTSTSENYKFSKEILDKKFGEYTTATITNTFHIYRAKRLAKLAGIETTTLHADTPWYSVPVMYVREWLAVIKLWLLKY